LQENQANYCAGTQVLGNLKKSIGKHAKLHGVYIRHAYFHIIPTIKFGNYVPSMQQICHLTAGTIIDENDLDVHFKR
jgi:hypothetical protein